MQKIITEEDYMRLVEFFRLLGDVTRLRIVLELKTKRCVGELAEKLDMSHSAVSHQLNVLKANGMVKSQRQGKYIYYMLQEEYVQNAIERCKILFDKEYSSNIHT